MSTTTSPLASAVVTPERPRPRTHALLLVLLATCLAVSGVPSPLYGTYAAHWHFSSLTTTLVFAAYAIGALLGLVVAGPLTDSRGRRPVLLGGVVVVLAGLVVFMTARGVAELVVARFLHGAAIGAIIVAAGAALLDLRPTEGVRAGRLTGIVFPIGMGVGGLGSALVAQYLPHPLVLPYAAVAVVVTVLLVGLVVTAETHEAPTRARVRLARPEVPAAIRGEFSFAVLGAAASWVVLGVYLSLFPGLAAARTGIHGLVFGGAVVAAMTASGAVAQLLTPHVDARRLALAGDAGMGVAVLLSVPAVLSGHAGLVVLTTVLLGAGFGIAFSGSVRRLSGVIPATSRGGVMAAFYLVCYSAMAFPAIAAGLAATHWTLAQTYTGFAVGVALTCLVAAAVGLRIARADEPVVTVTSVDPAETSTREEAAAGAGCPG